MPEVDYLVIDDSEVEPGAPILSSLGVRWRDNAIAIAQGASGAPRIDGLQNPAVLTGGIANGAVTQSKVATNAVNRSKIQTGTNSVSGSTNTNVTIELDQYSFFPSIGAANADLSVIAAESGLSGPNNPKLGLRSDSGASIPYDVAWRFVT